MTDFRHDEYRVRLERELRAAAPQARALFVDEVARRLHAQRSALRPTRVRMGLALAFSALTIVALGVLGAPGYVAHAATALVQTATTTFSGSNSTNTTTPVAGATSGTDQYAVKKGICHRTGDTAMPWVLIMVSADALDAHAAHGDIIPAPPAGCPPATTTGTAPRATTTQISGPSSAKISQPAVYPVSVNSGAVPVPSGTVSCFVDFQRIAADLVVTNGSATCKATFSSVGTHTITAVYKTDDVNKRVSSAANVLNVTVTKSTSTISLNSSQTPAPFGSGVTFRSVVTGPNGAPAPTGTVQFFDGSVALGSPVALTSSQTVAVATSALSSGTHTIKAAYSGDAAYDAANAVVSQVVTAPPPSPPTIAPEPQPLPQTQPQTAPTEPVTTTTTRTTTTITTTTTTTTAPEPQTQPAPQPVVQTPPPSWTTTVQPSARGSVAVAPMSGNASPTTVAWAPSTFGAAPVQVSATVGAPATTQGVQFAAGSSVIQIDAVTGAGQSITALNDALDIAIPNAPADVAPMYQRGDSPWVVIPRLAGTTLPAGQPDGWYTDGSTLHILTRHLTRFGLAKALDVRWGTRRRVHLRWAQRIVVYGAPNVDATATYTLRRAKKVYGTWKRTLPAGKGAPANLWIAGKNVVPGRYRLTIVIQAGPQRWTQVVAIRYLR